MSTTEKAIVARLSKDNGLLTKVTQERALERLSDNYRDPAGALWAATEQHPAETPFAYYWLTERPEAVAS